MSLRPAESAFRVSMDRLVDECNFDLYESDTKLSIMITYRMRRPNFHFRGRNRGNGEYARVVPSGQPTAGGDIDNLIKFTLDAMQGCLFVDDRQVVQISASKVYADSADSNGSTTVFIQPVP